MPKYFVLFFRNYGTVSTIILNIQNCYYPSEGTVLTASIPISKDPHLFTWAELKWDWLPVSASGEFSIQAWLLRTNYNAAPGFFVELLATTVLHFSWVLLRRPWSVTCPCSTWTRSTWGWCSCCTGAPTPSSTPSGAGWQIESLPGSSFSLARCSSPLASVWWVSRKIESNYYFFQRKFLLWQKITLTDKNRKGFFC